MLSTRFLFQGQIKGVYTKIAIKLPLDPKVAQRRRARSKEDIISLLYFQKL